MKLILSKILNLIFLILIYNPSFLNRLIEKNYKTKLIFPYLSYAILSTKNLKFQFFWNLVNSYKLVIKMYTHGIVTPTGNNAVQMRTYKYGFG